MILLTRRYQFRAIHRLADPDGHDEGVHGHHYSLEVTLQSPPKQIDEQSHWIQGRDEMDAVVQKKVLSLYDKADLNQFLPFTSGEYLAWDITQRLKEEFKGRLLQVSLQETRKNLFYFLDVPEREQINKNRDHNPNPTKKDDG